MGKRGQKTCDNCGNTTGPRTLECPSCGQPFFVRKGITKRNSLKQGVKCNWKELVPGDYIRVISGSGPYWPLDGDGGDDENDKCCMGYSGLFRVYNRDTKGLGCYPADSKNHGFCYIYMGPVGESDIGMVLRPHKIRKVANEVVERMTR